MKDFWVINVPLKTYQSRSENRIQADICDGRPSFMFTYGYWGPDPIPKASNADVNVARNPCFFFCVAKQAGRKVLYYSSLVKHETTRMRLSLNYGSQYLQTKVHNSEKNTGTFWCFETCAFVGKYQMRWVFWNEENSWEAMELRDTKPVPCSWHEGKQPELSLVSTDLKGGRCDKVVQWDLNFT